jgi:hypothetical protein
VRDLSATFVALAAVRRAITSYSEFSKSKMSIYLRTLCERELYLSLFSNNPSELEKASVRVAVQPFAHPRSIVEEKEKLAPDEVV